MDPSKAKPANFTRLYQLLVDKEGDALRNVVHAAIHPFSTLAAMLNAKKSCRKKRYSVIRDKQFPATQKKYTKKIVLLLAINSISRNQMTALAIVY